MTTLEQAQLGWENLSKTNKKMSLTEGRAGMEMVLALATLSIAESMAVVVDELSEAIRMLSQRL